MRLADLAVIVLYLVGMLAIGRYFAKRSQNADDFLLGGRRMNPVMVGISLFASLTSSLSYLFLPGELIRHGPTIFAQVLSYPVAVAIVGWLIIPAFMKLKVTSAYELLEARLGKSGRLLGASIFIILRLIWMSAILYATSEKILVPMFGLPQSAIPYCSIFLGVFTVVYTAEGGLRAVVLADALQSFIMLFGALSCVAVISISMGGVQQWWPTSWYAHWDRPVLFDSQVAHIPIVAAVVNQLVWLVCTAGSDQMAVQRYLATRNANTARRSLITSLIADVVVQSLLALTGLAVLGYFLHSSSSNSSQLMQSADELFPRFILTGLPIGLTGLLIAAILSAAMSATASGINSTCAVVVTDFIQLLRSKPVPEDRKVSLARYVSVVIGVITIAFSLVFAQLPGNLLEKCFKVVNLLAAPLFVLFFLSLFVPFATSVGAYAGVIVSIIVAIGISFGDWLHLGFLWMGACSLLSGIVVSVAVSAFDDWRRQKQYGLPSN